MMVHLGTSWNPMMEPFAWHAIRSSSGLMQPYKYVEDTLPWILNDVVEFEGCFKIKIIKYIRLAIKAERKIIKIHKVDHEVVRSLKSLVIHMAYVVDTLLYAKWNTCNSLVRFDHWSGKKFVWQFKVKLKIQITIFN